MLPRVFALVSKTLILKNGNFYTLVCLVRAGRIRLNCYGNREIKSLCPSSLQQKYSQTLFTHGPLAAYKLILNKNLVTDSRFEIGCKNKAMKIPGQLHSKCHSAFANVIQI